MSTATVAAPKYYRKHKAITPPCIYFKGVYYIPEDIKPSTVREGKPFSITGCFYDISKWRQDTFYITQETHDLLISVIPKA